MCCDKINLAAEQEWLDARVNRDLFTTSHSPRGCFLSQDRARENFIIRPYLLHTRNTHIHVHDTFTVASAALMGVGSRLHSNSNPAPSQRGRYFDLSGYLCPSLSRDYLWTVYNIFMTCYADTSDISGTRYDILTLAILTILTFRILYIPELKVILKISR